MHKKILLILLFFGISFSQDVIETAKIQDKGVLNKSYIISATVRLGKDASIEEAKKKAFYSTAETVLRRRSSFQLESRTILKRQNQGKFFDKLVSIDLDGEISKSETLVDGEIKLENGEILIEYKFQFWINQNKETERDTYFNIDASFNDEKEYYDGDSMILNFDSDSDCFMYLYNYLPYENKVKAVYKIKPSDGFYGKKFLTNKKLKPLKLTAKFGIECSDETKSFEHLILVAIKKEKDILFGKKEVTYEQFQKELKKIPRKDYETKMVSYIINENI